MKVRHFSCRVLILTALSLSACNSATESDASNPTTNEDGSAWIPTSGTTPIPLPSSIPDPSEGRRPRPTFTPSPTPTPTSSPSASPSPSGNLTGSAALDEEEWAFVTLINDYRALNGVPKLQVSIALTRASDWMSVDMATKNYFSHTDSIKRDPFTRMASFGYKLASNGENIAAGNSSAQATFTQWKNSAGHNANMLSGSYKVIGIGRAYNVLSTYKWYWTTDFGSIIDSTVQ